MGTQHPDHANIPFWHTEAFIPSSREVTECFLSFSELGISEYMWDWEGKMVDEAVLDRLFMDHTDYFHQHQVGKDKFLTFRLPNPKVETEYRLGRAFIGMLSASGLARHMDYAHDPLFEVILPMTETAHEMIHIQEAFREMTSLSHPLLKFGETTHIELIPLFETIDTIANSFKILSEYVELHQQHFGFKPTYIRPFIARSDPALNSGMIPTVLSIKIALQSMQQFEEKKGIALYPIIGAASLPFRGGLTPYTVKAFLNEYKGVKTTTIQSGFKYDYPKADVIKAIQEIEQTIGKQTPDKLDPTLELSLREVMKEFQAGYQERIESIAPVINTVASFLPKRRERVQHVGLFGYSRGVGKVKLPRAIGFTAALYSLGIPPEFIRTGKNIKQAGVDELYHNFHSDMVSSGAYLNRQVLASLAKKISGFDQIQSDIHELEHYLEVDFGPKTDEAKEHQELTTEIYQAMEEGTVPMELIERAGKIRKSLG